MVKIITDTTSCLSPEYAKAHKVPVIPQVINFGEESYLEGIDMNIADFMARLKTSSALPKTAAPPPELFAKEFRWMVPTGEPIICIHPSQEVSGTVRSAIVAAQDFPGADIRIIDTRLVSSPIATMVQRAVEWAEAGIDADTIVTRLEEMSKRCRVLLSCRHIGISGTRRQNWWSICFAWGDAANQAHITSSRWKGRSIRT